VNAVLQHLRKLEALAAAGTLSDGQLLQRFLADRDEAAFNALLQRHGPLVWSVCRRVLRCPHHAEDVFQATFLVLARRAASIRKHQSVASWLHGVAYRLARQLRAREARPPLPAPAPAADADPAQHAGLRELQAILDEELQRLGEAYRRPLVLCYLEGQTRDEAAGQLGWSLSTLKRRLDRGREALRARLSRRGVTLSGALLSAALAEDAGAAAPPAALLLPTTRAALLAAAGRSVTSIVPAQVLTLTEGVLHAMFVTKLKIAAFVTGVALTLGVGASLYGRMGSTAEGAQTTRPADNPAPVAATKNDDQALLKQLEKLKRELEEARLQAELARKEAAQERDQKELARQQAVQAAAAERKARAEAEVALQRALAEREKAEAERARADAAAAAARVEAERARAEALANLKAKADFTLPAKLKARAAPGGIMAGKTDKLPVELTLINEADAEVRFAPDYLRVVLLDKNGERVGVGVVKEPEQKLFVLKGGKGTVTVLSPHVTLDAKLRGGEEYFLVFTVGNQWALVRFTAKE
jgi:RNA polymerase sigma factor (sigma-70 family)